jgi:hypothetical protein
MEVERKGSSWVNTDDNGTFEVSAGSLYSETITRVKEQNYISQFERTQRAYERLKQCVEGKKVVGIDDFLDLVYAFFLNCYHLKDWIKNDPTFPRTVIEEKDKGDVVEKFIESHRELGICADLCNAHKHFKLDRKTRSYENPQVAKISRGTGISTDGKDVKITIAEYNFTVSVDSGEIDGFALATSCMELWRQFIQNNGGNI